MRTISRRREKERLLAAKNRRELVAARLGRRELLKMGLLTSGGMLIAKRGLSARAVDTAGDMTDPPNSPPCCAFCEPLPIMPVLEPVSALTPAPQADPNPLAGEGRTRSHQAFNEFPAAKLYEIHQRPALVSMSPSLPKQPIWGFNGITPGPTYHARYGEPIIVRNFNELPVDDNGGFGLPSVSTHLHNGHTPSESDGFPCDYYESGQWYDHHYPNVLAGFRDPRFAPTGDENETLSTLWYHDHRVDFTSQNVYKGLAGFFLIFSESDTGDETTGFRLPGGSFDIPMMFTDKLFDPETGLLFFDLFDTDGLVGDRFLVNGKVQPYLEVHPRRYRFRWLDGGPSRFYQFFLSDLADPTRQIPFWHICNDGNMLPKPLEVTSVRLGVAERADVIIDFSRFAPGTTIRLENRLVQLDGRGPTGRIRPAGLGDQVLEFRVVLPEVDDQSANPKEIAAFYALPSTPRSEARITRTFRFGRVNSLWTVNDRLMECGVPRFRVKQNTAEIWRLESNSEGWHHPIHIHFEEFQILSRDPGGIANVDRSRKDVLRMFDERVELFFRFRDFTGLYPMHCHNTVHEDHAMMLTFEIDPVGDNTTRP